jgi:outer membrane immunogenic protein
MRNILLSAVALSALAIGSASAADLPRRQAAAAPVPVYAAPIFTWTGFYVGGQVGYAWGTNKSNVTFPGIGPSVSYDGNGVVGGVHAGYNQQFGSLVAGLEGDFEASGVRGSASPAAGLFVRSRTDWQGSVRGRLGYAFDRVLVYGTGGVAFQNYKFDSFTGAGALSSSTTRAGWTIGAGVEYAINNNWSARLEYRYADFGKRSYGVPGGIVQVKNDDHTVRLGVSYHFGGPAGAVLARY